MNLRIALLLVTGCWSGPRPSAPAPNAPDEVTSPSPATPNFPPTAANDAIDEPVEPVASYRNQDHATERRVIAELDAIGLAPMITCLAGCQVSLPASEADQARHVLTPIALAGVAVAVVDKDGRVIAPAQPASPASRNSPRMGPHSK